MNEIPVTKLTAQEVYEIVASGMRKQGRLGSPYSLIDKNGNRCSIGVLSDCELCIAPDGFPIASGKKVPCYSYPCHSDLIDAPDHVVEFLLVPVPLNVLHRYHDQIASICCDTPGHICNISCVEKLLAIYREKLKAIDTPKSYPQEEEQCICQSQDSPISKYTRELLMV